MSSFNSPLTCVLGVFLLLEISSGAPENRETYSASESSPAVAKDDLPTYHDLPPIKPKDDSPIQDRKTTEEAIYAAIRAVEKKDRAFHRVQLQQYDLEANDFQKYQQFPPKQVADHRIQRKPSYSSYPVNGVASYGSNNAYTGHYVAKAEKKPDFQLNIPGIFNLRVSSTEDQPISFYKTVYFHLS